MNSKSVLSCFCATVLFTSVILESVSATFVTGMVLYALGNMFGGGGHGHVVNNDMVNSVIPLNELKKEHSPETQKFEHAEKLKRLDAPKPLPVVDEDEELKVVESNKKCQNGNNGTESCKPIDFGSVESNHTSGESVETDDDDLDLSNSASDELGDVPSDNVDLDTNVDNNDDLVDQDDDNDDINDTYDLLRERERRRRQMMNGNKPFPVPPPPMRPYRHIPPPAPPRPRPHPWDWRYGGFPPPPPPRREGGSGGYALHHNNPFERQQRPSPFIRNLSESDESQENPEKNTYLNRKSRAFRATVRRPSSVWHDFEHTSKLFNPHNISTIFNDTENVNTNMFYNFQK